ncbi:MAG: hypothetical protein IKI84_00930 [Clostridia bacterium]|nr:hypothetical protein [Clostridia bacterium]
MMERFFVYSRDHARPIRLMVLPQDGEKAKYLNVICVEWDADELKYIKNSIRDKKLRSISLGKVLSASYARGDDGETMQYERQDGDE